MVHTANCMTRTVVSQILQRVFVVEHLDEIVLSGKTGLIALLTQARYLGQCSQPCCYCC